MSPDPVWVAGWSGELSVGSVRNFLQPPFLPPPSAAVAAAATVSSWPVWLAGGPGAGAYHVARALHLGGDPAGFLSVRRLLADPADLERRLGAALDADPELDDVALYVERIERQPAGIQELCLRWIDEGTRRGGRSIVVRLFAQSDRTDLPPNVAGLLPALGARLSALVIPLPALAVRRDDALALARFLAADAARRIGRAADSVDEETLRRLARSAPTVEALEASLVREMLLGAPEPATRETEPEAAVPAATFATARSPILPASYSLDALITELAHELKNPMVTIKTFAQHLDHLLSDPELREKFSRLTNEAVDRMDSFLDELLQFSRFVDPVPRPFVARELMERALAGLDAEIREQVRLNGLPAAGSLRADTDQIGFAFRALVRGLLRELPAGAGIVLDSGAAGELVFQAMGAGGTRKLHTLLHPDIGTEEETSLHFALATALIRRNGGSCQVLRGRDSLEARVTLPVGENP